ncbi:glycosyltransferase [Nitrospinae bacterium AH-259-F20]|nr:glycosyltransferase [Nitrospinae bacterium AH-259-F20]
MVEELIEAFKRVDIFYEVIVIQDNSTDGTRVIMEELTAQYPEVRAVHRASEPGFGKALRAGIEASTGDAICFVMGDHSDDSEDVVAMARKIHEGYDVVYGSRFIPGGSHKDYPHLKLIVNRLANWGIKWLFGVKSNDITNAFKAYSMRAIRAIEPVESDYFNITVELPIKAHLLGFSMVQIPVRWYGRESGVSKLSIARMSRQYLQTVLHLFIHRRSFAKSSMENVSGGAASRTRDWGPHWVVQRQTLFGKFLLLFRKHYWVRNFVKFAMKHTEPGRILEAGCGSALASIMLHKKRGDSIAALDISPDAIALAKRQAELASAPITVHQESILQMPFEDKKFDLCWNAGTLEHFEDPVSVVKEMKRVARVTIAIVPDDGWAWKALLETVRLLGPRIESYFNEEGYYKLYRTKELREVFEKVGFGRVVVEEFKNLGVFGWIAAAGFNR